MSTRKNREMFDQFPSWIYPLEEPKPVQRFEGTPIMDYFYPPTPDEDRLDRLLKSACEGFAIVAVIIFIPIIIAMVVFALAGIK